MTQTSASTIERFADGLDHPEGLAFTSDGILWAGGEAGQIYRIKPDGSWSVEGETGGTCLGIAVGTDDRLYICDPTQAAVIRRDFDGRTDIVLDHADDRALDAPNFPVFGPDGALYVSCSGTWGRSDGWIVRRDQHGMTDVIWTDLDLANGLAIDASGDHIYVAETCADRVRRKSLRSPGDEPELVIGDLDRLPDGLAFDALGTLYITCYASDRIYALTSQGELTIVADDRESRILSHPTNCAFGGAAFDELYVACYGLHHIARVPMLVRGQALYGGPRARPA